MRKPAIFVCVLILTASMLTACGAKSSSGLSDEIFSVEAKNVCSVLQIELESAQTLEQELTAFSKAADAMKAFDLDPETAPQAEILRDSLTALVMATLVFDDALDEAVREYEWTEYTWMIFGSNVSAFSNEIGIFGMEILDVDEAVVQDYIGNRQAVHDAAAALGLDGCQINADSESE